MADTVITADCSIRGGKIIELKKVVDEALKKCPQIQRVFVMNGNDTQISWKSDRDLSLEKVRFRNFKRLTVQCT